MFLYTTREALSRLVNASVQLVNALAEKTEITAVSGATILPGSTLSRKIEIPVYKNSMAVEVNVTYDESATAGGNLDIYYSVDGINYDTKTDQGVILPFTAGSTEQQTFIFPAATNHAEIRIVNNDATYDLTVNSVKVVFLNK